MRTLTGWAGGMQAGLRALEAALGRPAAALEARLPRRVRRLVERLQRGGGRPLGHYAAAGFLGAAMLYGVTVGGHLGRLCDALLIAAGFGIEHVVVTGHAETSELTVLQALDLGGAALPTFGAAEARERLADLPWVAGVSVRKLYPGTLEIAIVERKAFALWQHDGVISIIERDGHPIVELDDPRYARLPLVVGAGANVRAEAFLSEFGAFPALAARSRAAIRVGERRWNLVLDKGVTVKLPEGELTPALQRLVRLDADASLFSRDVSEIDLRLSDRVSVRLPKETADARTKAIESEVARLARAEARL